MNVVWIFLLSLAVLAVIAYVAGFVLRRSSQNTQQPAPIEACEEKCGEGCCSGLNCQLVKPATKIVYFDDEELDVFKGRKAADYSDEETDKFREILYTMRVEDVPEWIQSLQLRCVEIPQKLKDELILIINDLRNVEQIKK
ncbi:MAG: phospholipase [Bacteroidales bacterium]|nr:phospholipase [Bacteroidales bacterium]